MQTVGIQKGLEILGELLSRNGFQVAPMENSSIPVSGVISCGACCEIEGPTPLTNSLEIQTAGPPEDD